MSRYASVHCQLCIIVLIKKFIRHNLFLQALHGSIANIRQLFCHLFRGVQYQHDIFLILTIKY